MARTPRKSSLDTRTGRAKIKDANRHWVMVGKGLALGYRKGKAGGTWYLRQMTGAGTHRYEAIGSADDHLSADGISVLDYFQAAERVRQAAAETAHAPRRYTVADALDDYLEWFKANRKSAKDTEKTIETHIRPKLGKLMITDLSAKDIRRWMQDTLAAPRRVRGKEKQLDPADVEAVRKRKATINRVLTVLKAALNFAYHEGRTPSADEWRKVKPYPGADAPKIRYLSKAECTRLINACEPDFRQLVQAALLTGCRYGELIRLEVGDYHADAGAIHVRDSKASKPRFIPLTKEGQDFFKRMTAGRTHGAMFTHDSIEWVQGDGEKMEPRTIRIPWGESHQSRPMKAACLAAKIEPAVTFHDLRHSYASLLAMAGVPLQIIAAALGHADTRVTARHYAHLSPDHVADQIRANLPSFGIQMDNVRAIK